MRKILLSIALLSISVFANDSSTVNYYRNSTYKEKDLLIVKYVQPVIKDTIDVSVIPGSSLPFSITVKDGVIVDNTTMIIMPKKTISIEQKK